MTTRNYKVRFHLAAGPHFMHWQIRNGSDRLYVDPATHSVVMIDCVLKNRKSVARQIHAGGHKVVCAWIACKHIQIIPSVNAQVENPISYNPRVAPYWRNLLNENIDGRHYESIVSSGRSLETMRSVPEVKASQG